MTFGGFSSLLVVTSRWLKGIQDCNSSTRGHNGISESLQTRFTVRTALFILDDNESGGAVEEALHSAIGGKTR